MDLTPDSEGLGVRSLLTLRKENKEENCNYSCDDVGSGDRVRLPAPRLFPKNNSSATKKTAFFSTTLGSN